MSLSRREESLTDSLVIVAALKGALPYAKLMRCSARSTSDAPSLRRALSSSLSSSGRGGAGLSTDLRAAIACILCAPAPVSKREQPSLELPESVHHLRITCVR